MRACWDPINQGADAGLVVAARGELARKIFPEDGLQLGKTRKTKVFGKTHHRAGLDATLTRHFLNAFDADVVAVFFNVQRNGLELLAQRFVFAGDALDGLIGVLLGGGVPGHGCAVF